MIDPREFSERLAKAVEAADLAFWAEIAKAFPEADKGDFSPDATITWNKARDLAVYRWMMFNHPDNMSIDRLYRS